jgi:hypothetical protein
MNERNAANLLRHGRPDRATTRPVSGWRHVVIFDISVLELF